MDVLRFFLVLSASKVIHSNGYHYRKFRCPENPTISNYRLISDTTRSSINCAVTCSNINGCNKYKFNSTTNECFEIGETFPSQRDEKSSESVMELQDEKPTASKSCAVCGYTYDKTCDICIKLENRIGYKRNWTAADQECAKDGGGLLSSLSLECLHMVYNVLLTQGFIDPNECHWLGAYSLNQKSVIFHWMDGSIVTLLDVWYHEDRNNAYIEDACACIKYTPNTNSHYMWFDRFCSDINKYICINKIFYFG